MTTTLAVANQKGGVAKTTSVASIGAALAELGHTVLLVDLDPQACLTFSLGIDPEDLELSIHHVLTKGVDPAEVIIETEDGVDLLPATIELARAEADLLTRTGREHVLKGVLDDLADSGRHYDWVLLDCPPSLGVLTVAALTAADGVLIPLQCETLSHRGVGQLLDTVHDVRRFTNRDLEVWGVLPTLYDGRTNHARTVLETISETYDLDVIEPPIPKTIRFAEAPAAGRSILRTSRHSKGAKAYREVAGGAGRRRREPAVSRTSGAAPSAGTQPRRPGPATGASRCCGRRSVTVVSVLGGSARCPRSATTPAPRSRPTSRRPAARGQADRTRHRRPRRPSRSRPSPPAGPPSAQATERNRPPGCCRATPGTGRRVVFSEGGPAGLAGRRRRRRAAYLSGVGQHVRQPRPGHLRGLLPLRERHRHRGLGVDEVVRPVRARRHRRRDRLPRHPGRRRCAGADRRPARHARLARLHPSAHRGRKALWQFAPVGTTVVVVA